MLIQYASLLAASTLLAGTAIASQFEERSTNMLLSRQLTPANCPVDLPGSQTCDSPGHCYDPAVRICCGDGSGGTCRIGNYCDGKGCCPIGKVCTRGGGTLTLSSVITIASTSVSTIPVVVISTSTSTISYTSTSVVPSSSSTYMPPSAPASSSSALATGTAVPIPVPASSSTTVTPSPVVPVNTPSVAPPQFTGGAVPITGEMAGGVLAAIVGVMGLVGLL